MFTNSAWEKYSRTLLFYKAQLFRSVEQLTDHVHLVTSARSICVFGLVGFHNELYASHTQKYICYIHAQHWMIEVARQVRGKWRKCCWVPWSAEFVVQWSDVSIARKSPIQTTRSIVDCSGILFAVPGVWSFEVLAKCVWPRNRCLREDSWRFVKICEDLWRFVKIRADIAKSY